MKAADLFWTVFGAILSTLLADVSKRLERGKKRLVYYQRGDTLTLKNNWGKTLTMEDFSKVDPLRIHLDKENIRRLNKDFTDKKEPHGFKFSKNGILRFQYWESNIVLILFLNNSVNVKITGTMIDGQLISYKTAKNEYQKKYNITKTISMAIFYTCISLLICNIFVDNVVADILMIVSPSILIYSYVLSRFYKLVIKSLIS